MNRVGLWEQLFHSLYNGNNAVGLAGSALSAVDIALWDLAGQAARSARTLGRSCCLDRALGDPAAWIEPE